MKACAFCKRRILPTEDHYRDHDMRLACKECAAKSGVKHG